MSNDIDKQLKRQRTRNYLAKDFPSLRSDLLRYARIYFPDQIQDFSEASVGGLFMDMAAYVGDTMSYYLDHQFNELNPLLAIESDNIERHARAAGLQIAGASPALVEMTFLVQVPIDINGDPDASLLPIIKENTSVISSNGVKFYLIEDIDFSETHMVGDEEQLIATVQDVKSRTTGEVTHKILTRNGQCVSGEIKTINIAVPNSFQAFRKYTLPNNNVSEIMRVVDSDNNLYYEVGSLTQDTVFTQMPNPYYPQDPVKSTLKVQPAPYRFVTETSMKTRMTSLMFGSGNSTIVDDDIIPDPSDLSLPLYGKKHLSRFSIDPNALLGTKTLGVAPQNTTLSITYRYGGGISHNVSARAISDINTLDIEFPAEASADQASNTRATVACYNLHAASGGANAQTIDELRGLIPAARNLQSRIVTREDLLARIYTLPNTYGRVYRAAILPNPNNPLAGMLYILSKNAQGQLIIAPQVLKDNIKTYLNEFRLIGDALDVMDAHIVNFGLTIEIVVTPNVNKYDVVAAVLKNVQEIFRRDKIQIGMPIIESDIQSAAFMTPGVMSLVGYSITNLKNVQGEFEYSATDHDFEEMKVNGMYYLNDGGIFELRYPDNDIKIVVK